MIIASLLDINKNWFVTLLICPLSLSFSLCRITDQRYENVPYFLFGDFNFRLDSKQVIQVRRLYKAVHLIEYVHAWVLFFILFLAIAVRPTVWTKVLISFPILYKEQKNLFNLKWFISKDGGWILLISSDTQWC